jgi:polysaccharide export outer membrane protein
MFNICVYRWQTFIPALIIVFCLSSCFGGRKARKDSLYLQGNLDTLPNLIVAAQDVTIQKGDLLSIVFFSDNPEATAIYNQQQMAVSSGSGIGSGTSGAGAVTNGFLVDLQGNIYIQSLGSVRAEGLTRQELSKLLGEKLTPFLKNPYANIRFLNFKFSILGEVNKPGSYVVPDEKRFSVLDLLALAGDRTVYGRLDNILVIRENDGKRKFGRIDLRKSDAFQSPYYYLQQNDMVMVEASAKKPNGSEQATLRNLSIVTGFASLVSVAAIIINFFR